jgi:DNA mismatch endonuclease, patch repair protein
MDVLTPEQRRLNMSRIRGQDTAPEITIRRALHARGFRFRLQNRKLPGRPDIVLPKYQTVIFVHGCFWHRHECALFKWPTSRREFWEQKILRNCERDKLALMKLQEMGWRVLIIWECTLKGPARLPLPSVIEECANFLRSPDIRFDEIPGGKS